MNHLLKKEIKTVIADWKKYSYLKNLYSNEIKKLSSNYHVDWFTVACNELTLDTKNTSEMISLAIKENNSLVVKAFEDLVFCAKMVCSELEEIKTDKTLDLSIDPSEIVAKVSITEKKIRTIVLNLKKNELGGFKSPNVAIYQQIIDNFNIDAFSIRDLVNFLEYFLAKENL